MRFIKFVSGPFLKIANISTAIIKQSANWPNHVQCSAIICLMKMMAASRSHARQMAPMIFTVFMKTPISSVEHSILACFADLLVRHPNIIEPWTSCIFEKLRSASHEMRTLTLSLIRDLASKKLIKVTKNNCHLIIIIAKRPAY
jgi:hypothetical protein